MPKYKFTFNKWASTYDEHVSKASLTDDWMFGGYDRVLDKIVEYSGLEEKVYISVLEIGVGTGNLAARFLERGLRVYGIEPSRKMRKACKKKFPGIEVSPGDFLKYPGSLPPVDLIISAYAFHHLTETEKSRAVTMMKNQLKPGGRIVLADFMYQNPAAVLPTADIVRDRNGGDIIGCFKGEYLGYYDNICRAFAGEDFKVDGEQLTVSVWLVRARL